VVAALLKNSARAGLNCRAAGTFSRDIRDINNTGQSRTQPQKKPKYTLIDPV